MPKVHVRPLAEHRRVVLDRIYRAFEALISERGYDAITLADIAKAADLARTGIYHYFRDKESLLVAYTAHEMDDLFSDLRAELHEIDDPLERLDACVAAQLTYVATHQLPPAAALHVVLSADGQAAMAAHTEILEAMLGAVLAEAAAEGLVPAHLAQDRHTAPLLVGMLSSGATRGLRGRRLRTTIEATQAFVRRAVGASA